MSEFDALRRDIDLVLAEYEQDIDAALRWLRGWRERQEAAGFRCQNSGQSAYASLPAVVWPEPGAPK